MKELPQDDTVLVTGAGGRLGKLLRAAARRDGFGAHRVLFQSRAPGTDITWSPGDALSAMPDCGTVVALWGATGGTKDQLAVNAALVETSAAVARACGARRLIHISSAAVYGPGQALREDSPTCPAGAYGASKLEMERAVARLPDDGGFRNCCLRLANVVGADSLAPALRRDAPVELHRFPDGAGPLRSYVAAGDLMHIIRGLAALAPSALPGVLNVASPRPVGMEDLARAAGRAINWHPAPATAVKEITLDARKLLNLLPDTRLLSAPQELIADWLELESEV